MGDAAWLRSAIGIADAATRALGIREDVTVERGGTSDAFGTPLTLGTTTTHAALVERKRGVLQTSQSGEVKYEAMVSFVGPLDIDESAKVTLRDGVTGPLYIPQGGQVDPATGQPFYRTVYLRR